MRRHRPLSPGATSSRDRRLGATVARGPACPVTVMELADGICGRQDSQRSAVLREKISRREGFKVARIATWNRGDVRMLLQTEAQRYVALLVTLEE